MTAKKNTAATDNGKVDVAAITKENEELKKEVAALSTDNTELFDTVTNQAEKIKKLEKTVEELMTVNQNSGKPAEAGIVTHAGIKHKVLTPKFHLMMEGQMKTVTIEDLKKDKDLMAAAIKAGNVVPLKESE